MSSSKNKILVVSFQSLTANSAGGMGRLGYYLSRELHQRGLLDKFIVYAKGKFTTDFPCEPVSKWSRYYLFFINTLNKYLKLPAHKFRLLQEHQYDRFCVQHVTKNTDILFTTNAHMRRTFKKAKALGIPIVYIPANQEENIINQLVTEEREKLNINNIDAYTYQPRLDYYNESIKLVDTIIGTYPTVYDSYLKAGTNSEVINITGHLKPDFKPYTLEERARKNTVHIGYLAHTVVLKGLQYLLEGWEALQQEHANLDIELSIAGYIEPKLKEYILEQYKDLKKVNYLGHLADVPSYLKQLDLFVVPSLSEGGPYTALEAAHYGIPVLITDNCGSAELLSRNDSGCVTIPIKDAKRIKEELYKAYNNRAVLTQMGINAKANLDNYNMQELFSELADYLEKTGPNKTNKGKIKVVSFQSLSENSGQGMARLGYYLSEELHKRGLLDTFVMHSKGKHTTYFPSEPVSYFSRLYLFILNRLNKQFNFKSHKFRFLQERLFDWFCSKKITSEIDILFMTFPFLKRTQLKAKELGIKTILLSGTPEENSIFNIVAPENEKMGITTLDAYTYPQRLKYFNDSIQYTDVVVGSLPPAYTSYRESNAFNGKLIKLTGHMPPDFKPIVVKEKDSTKKRFIVGYLAYTVVLKGLQYLLEAWEEITKEDANPHLELQIGGGMDDQTKVYIETHFGDIKQVKFLGHITDVGAFFENLDLFVVPSLIDGAPVTALEAAHYEVPVLITNNSGSAELLSREESGCIVIPIKDAPIIAEKILWADTHRADAIQMGKNAKKNLEDNNFPLFIKQLANELEKEF